MFRLLCAETAPDTYRGHRCHPHSQQDPSENVEKTGI